MSFDRLVRAVDAWAAERGRDDVFAQIGPAAWRPQHIRWTILLVPSEFKRVFDSAEAIVSHAGVGTTLTALQAGKPILVLPRRSARDPQ